jgi:hypothetical protein
MTRLIPSSRDEERQPVLSSVAGIKPVQGPKYEADSRVTGEAMSSSMLPGVHVNYLIDNNRGFQTIWLANPTAVQEKT